MRCAEQQYRRVKGFKQLDKLADALNPNTATTIAA
jgi:hypothetical protein